MKEKIIFVVILVLLFFGCTRKIKLEENKTTNSIKPIMIELNTKINYEFGLPVESEYFSKLFFCLSDGDTSKKEFGEQIFVIRMKGNSLFFEYKKKDKIGSIKGEYKVPSYMEIEYQKAYDIGSEFANDIIPLKVYVPIRTGTWYYNDGSKEDTIQYDINIDDSRINNFCK